MSTVYIVGEYPGQDSEYSVMFRNFGIKTVFSLEEAQLVQFTGGADVSPYLYGEKKHSTSYCDSDRDAREIIIFKRAMKLGLPMAGICRGGQFLNVMCGGRLWQDVDGHTASHYAWDAFHQDFIRVTSTHHQMMIAGPGSQLVMSSNMSTQRHFCSKMSNTLIDVCLKTGKNCTALEKDEHCVFLAKDGVSSNPDVESLLYEKERVFCFQPHPEFLDQHKLATRYMDHVNSHLNPWMEEK